MSDDARRELLARHYHNAVKYGERLNKAIEKIQSAIQAGSSEDVTVQEVRRAVAEALATEKPPSPFENFYKDGYHTGHPHVEYMILPGLEYIDP